MSPTKRTKVDEFLSVKKKRNGEKIKKRNFQTKILIRILKMFYFSEIEKVEEIENIRHNRGAVFLFSPIFFSFESVQKRYRPFEIFIHIETSH